ncbi:MAG: DUF1080 domain-containing protein [Planctomycetota bacterium]|nr:DUF1080 domain-containing protein [Planctomycetota bacterium]
MKPLHYTLLVASAIALAVALVPLAPAAEEKKPAAPAADWTPLFSGKDLAGWKPNGSAVWKVEDDYLVGTQTDGKGGDLFTEQSFDNFECRVTYRVVWPANSGFWFRDQYQFDVLKYANPVAYSGTLYCPGKMFIFANLDESIENRDGWNEAQIYANGDHIIQWLNGKKMGECNDKSFAKGRFGIQVHPGNEMKGMKIIVKRFDVRPLKEGDKPSDPVTPKAEK